MAENLAVSIYRTDLEFDSSGLDDSDAIGVVSVMSSVWNPTGDPTVVYDDVLDKLVADYTVSSEVTHRARYRLVPDGTGGYKRVRRSARTINVSVASKTVAVDLSWDEDQGPPVV